MTGQEAALLWALDSCPAAATPRQLAALLSERAGRAIPRPPGVDSCTLARNPVF